MTTLFASATCVVGPKIFHRLAKVVDDIGAIEVDVFNQGPAIVAVENDVLMFTGGPPSLDDQTHRVRRAHRGVRNIWRNEESLPFPDQMIDDLVALADADFDVAFELIKVLLGVHLMKIVPRVRALNDHDKKIASVVKVTVADRGFEFLSVFLDPTSEINRRLNRRRGAFLRSRRFFCKSGHETTVFP